MKKNTGKFFLFSALFYGLWMLVFPVFFFLPLILLLLYMVQQQFTGTLAARATLSALCAIPFLVLRSADRLTGSGAEPMMDYLLALTWIVILLYWSAAMLTALVLRRSRRGKPVEATVPNGHTDN